jgi:hypothetical protein
MNSEVKKTKDFVAYIKKINSQIEKEIIKIEKTNLKIRTLEQERARVFKEMAFDIINTYAN